MQKRFARYDKAGEEHFNLLSAYHKSLRGSDPQGALYWMARMLDGGEDPMTLFRRAIAMAAEDIGLADPNALVMAVAARDAFHMLGPPEGYLPLAEMTIYLATAPKSNSAKVALGAALAAARDTPAAPVPLHIRNAPTGLMKELGYGKGYRYAHDSPEAYLPQEYLPDELRGHDAVPAGAVRVREEGGGAAGVVGAEEGGGRRGGRRRRAGGRRGGRGPRKVVPAMPGPLSPAVPTSSTCDPAHGRSARCPGIVRTRPAGTAGYIPGESASRGEECDPHASLRDAGRCAARGCAGLPGNFKDPDLRLQRVIVRGVGLTGGTMDLIVGVYNPNSFDLHGTRLQVGFDVEGSHVGDVEYDDDFQVQKGDTTALTLPVRFNWNGLAGAVRTALGYGDLPYTLKGQLTVETPFGDAQDPVHPRRPRAADPRRRRPRRYLPASEAGRGAPSGH